MKKWYIFLFFFAIIFLSGCRHIDKNEIIEQSVKEYEFNNTYYKVAVKECTYNDNDLIEYLIEDIDSYSSKIEKMRPHNIGITIYTLQTNNTNYRWDISDSKEDFSYIVNEQYGYEAINDTEKTLQHVDRIIYFFEKIGLELVLRETMQATSKESVDAVNYCYAQGYEGIPITYKNVRVGNMIVNAPFVSIGIDGTGIRSVNLAYGYLGFEEIVEEYEVSDFISIDEVETKAINYCRSIWKSSSGNYEQISATITDIEIVYYLTIENNKKYIMPAYEITVVGTTEDKLRCKEEILVMDVFNGYVHH